MVDFFEKFQQCIRIKDRLGDDEFSTGFDLFGEAAVFPFRVDGVGIGSDAGNDRCLNIFPQRLAADINAAIEAALQFYQTDGIYIEYSGSPVMKRMLLSFFAMHPRIIDCKLIRLRSRPQQ